MKKFKLPRKAKKRYKKACRFWYSSCIVNWFTGYYNAYDYQHYKQTGQPLPF